MSNARPLGAFEAAQVRTNEHFPFNVVTALTLEPGPDPVILRRALAVLRDRHPMLRARVTGSKGRYQFRLDQPQSPVLTVRAHPSAESWLEVTENELNTGFDVAGGPLLRMTALLSPAGDARHLIISAQHAAFDAVSGTHLLGEILRLCALLATGRAPREYQPLPLMASADSYFPAAFKGAPGALRRLSFIARQLADEAAYRWRCRGLRTPAAISARCRVHSVRMSEAQTAALARRCRRQRVTVNSALCAAQLLAASERLPDWPVLRHFVFADMRPYLAPPLAAENLGSYFAMLRLTTDVSDTDLWTLARKVGRQVHAAVKRGDKFTSWSLSGALMGMVLRMRESRMGHAALAYGGAARLDDSYGDIRITGLNAFVSNFVLGPPYTANARRFLGRLWWDMVYLDSDLDSASAAEVAGRVLELLNSPQN